MPEEFLPSFLLGIKHEFLSLKELDSFLANNRPQLLNEKIIFAEMLCKLLEQARKLKDIESISKIEQRLNLELNDIKKEQKTACSNNESVTKFTSVMGHKINLNQLEKLDPNIDNPEFLSIKNSGKKFIIFGLLIIPFIIQLYLTNWFWLSIFINIISIGSIVIGYRLTRISLPLNYPVHFFNGLLTPGIVVGTNDGYDVIFMAGVKTNDESKTHWLLKRVYLNKDAGDLAIGSRIAATSIFVGIKDNAYFDFYPTPVCIGTSSILINYEAQKTIPEKEWEQVEAVIEQYQKMCDYRLTLDSQFNLVSINHYPHNIPTVL